MIRLSELTPQELHRILDITAEPLVRERLLELGLAPGRRVRLLRTLPFAGPVIVQSGTVIVALRQEEATHVWVEPMVAEPVEGRGSAHTEVPRV